jgi:glutathione S-transferase
MEIARPGFERAKADAVAFIRANGRLPAQVWIGSQALTLADFAATVAVDDGVAPSISLRKGNPEMEKYVATDPGRPFNWAIHPEGFQAPHILDLARLQAWTLKPAVLR